MLGLDIEIGDSFIESRSPAESQKVVALVGLAGLGLSIPTVIFGRNFATRSVGQQAWRVFPLKAGSDEMELKFCLMPNRDLQKSNRAGVSCLLLLGTSKHRI